MAEIYGTLDAHLASFWPTRARDEVVWTYGPIWTVLPRFRVVRVRPHSSRDPWIYLTRGAWEVGARDDVRLEFFLMSPTEEILHSELLTMVAHLHADPEHHLDLGHTTNIGRPWLPESRCDHLLVSLPYPFGPALEWCEAPSVRIRFLWLLPITEAEKLYRHREGLEALEQRFDAGRIDALDRNRASVV